MTAKSLWLTLAACSALLSGCSNWFEEPLPKKETQAKNNIVTVDSDPELSRSMQQIENLIASGNLSQAERSFNELVQKSAEKKALAELSLSPPAPEEKATQSSKQSSVKTSQPSAPLSLEEARTKAQQFIDQQNGLSNPLVNEFQHQEVHIFEFREADTKRIVPITVNTRTGALQKSPVYSGGS